MRRQNKNRTKKTNGKSSRGVRSNVRVVPRNGTINNAPDVSGTVQIPRPLSVRALADRRTFKTSITLSTSASAQIYQYLAMYAPFGINGSFSSSPATFLNMLTVFGAYKVKRVQLIFEPLIPSMSAIVPVPYVICMAPDIQTPNSSSNPPLVLENYQNATKVSPLYPAELAYNIPKISAGLSSTVETLAGGWILSESLQSTAQSGSIIVCQNAGATLSTSYSQLSVVYDVMFKNPI